jgi:hypothetical protein
VQLDYRLRQALPRRELLKKSLFICGQKVSPRPADTEAPLPVRAHLHGCQWLVVGHVLDEFGIPCASGLAVDDISSFSRVYGRSFGFRSRSEVQDPEEECGRAINIVVRSTERYQLARTLEPWEWKEDSMGEP